MQRAMLVVLVLLAALLTGPAASAITIDEGDLNPFTGPCTLSVQQNGSVRTLSWSTVSGAASYKVGYRTGGVITGLAELTGTSYDHTGWNPDVCLEYVLVAYDSSGAKICSAHVENVGTICPQ